MVSYMGMVLSIALAAQVAPSHRASDVELIANWLSGNDPTKAFERPFGDKAFLTKAKSPLLYTDVVGVKAPSPLKPVHYEAIQARMRAIKSGHMAAPAVLIVRSSFDEPGEGLIEKLPAHPKKDGRVYYVEVAIGNLAWHWLRIVIHDEDGGKKKATIVSSKVS